MHGAVGTTIGGVCTLVGEPQNLLIGKEAGWEFIRFAAEMAPVTMPTVIAGLATCLVVERFAWFGYGSPVPAAVRQVLLEFERRESAQMTPSQKHVIVVQAVVRDLAGVRACISCRGDRRHRPCNHRTGDRVYRHRGRGRLGKAFEAALPFTALLVVFFAIVGMIHQQDLFGPFLEWVLRLDPIHQPIALFGASGFCQSSATMYSSRRSTSRKSRKR